MLCSYVGMGFAPMNIDDAETLGELLADKRESFRGTPEYFEQYAVANAVGFSQTYVSQIEKGVAEGRIKKWPSVRQRALLNAYRFTEDEIMRVAERFDLDPSLKRPQTQFPFNTLPELRGVGNMVELEILQAQGGTEEDPEDAGGRRTIQLFEVFLDGHNPKDCKVVELFGESMVCEDVRLSFEPGARFIINTAEEPQEDDLLVADLFKYGEWHRIFKIFGRQGRLTLESLNKKHPPIVLEPGDKLMKVGIYINRLPEDRHEMRRLNRERMRRQKETV